MSGFAADWLALRERADRRARNGEVLTVVADAFKDRDRIAIVDLGCGTGSNLRALAEHLPERQHWRLVDNDPALLQAARAALARWADRCSETAGGLALDKSGRVIAVTFEQADLAEGLGGVLDSAADLVTAAAFFDLVSGAWIADFCRALTARALPLYTVLTYEGAEIWAPPHAADCAMLTAFHAHQARDKGFGPAAGPVAAALLQAELQSAGYEIESGASPWRLGAGDAALIATLAEGAAAAVAETGLVAGEDCRAWCAARVAAKACTIGHVDIFARPRR